MKLGKPTYRRAVHGVFVRQASKLLRQDGRIGRIVRITAPAVRGIALGSELLIHAAQIVTRDRFILPILPILPSCFLQFL